ncbi:MAG: hypothetical protein SOZ04_04285 [Bacilli bacterium]|nr:hypothetical protein [Bacilli bacterium]
MIKIITQELKIESNLKQRLEFIWEFCHIKPTIINGSIRKIDKTNLSYIEPHKIIVKDTTFLVFNYSTDIYVGSLNKKIQLVELKDYWNFSKDLYTHNIFSDKTIESIQDDYIWNKENDKNKNKEKNDYEIGM